MMGVELPRPNPKKLRLSKEEILCVKYKLTLTFLGAENEFAAVSVCGLGYRSVSDAEFQKSEVYRGLTVGPTNS